MTTPFNDIATQNLAKLLREYIGPTKVPTYPVLHLNVATLVAQGADLSVRGDDGHTPLSLCLSVEDPVSHTSVPVRLNEILMAVIRELISGGADLAQTGPCGRTPHELAQRWPMDGAARMLAAEESRRAALPAPLGMATLRLMSLLKTPLEGRTATHFSSVVTLLEAGADIHARDENGHTAFQLLVMRGPSANTLSATHDVLERFLAAGADITTPLSDGRTIAAALKDWSDDSIATRMLSAEEARRADPYLAKHVRTVKFWWPAAGTVPEDKDRIEFLGSCQRGNLDHVHYMLRTHKTCVDWAYDSGNTGLITAVLSGIKRLDVTALLLAHGADPNSANDFGMTALMYAAKLREAVDCIEPLIAKGADETRQSSTGDTAVQYARALSSDGAAHVRLMNAVAKRNLQKEADRRQRQRMYAHGKKLRLGK